jgi:hypothetical protein
MLLGLLRINAIVVDSAALLLRVGAWMLMTWAPLAAFAQFFVVTRHESVPYAPPEVVVASSLVIPALVALGLAMRWLSMGLVHRRRTELLLVGIGALLCTGACLLKISWIGVLAEPLAHFPSMPGWLPTLFAAIGVSAVSSVFVQPRADKRY